MGGRWHRVAWGVALGACWCACFLADEPLSAGRYYTTSRVLAGRANVARFDWAQRERERIIESGDPIRYYIGPEFTSARVYGAQSDEVLWLLQPETSLRRTYDYADGRALCPLHGDAIRAANVWCPWRIDPLNHPYRIQCPLGGEWYPSNAYHRGDLSSGDFADAGEGCVYEGRRYHFLEEYAAMVYGSVVVPTLNSLSQAYLLTGEASYAHKGAVLLVRLASHYPNYGWEGTDFTHLEDRSERTYVAPWGGSHPYYKGKKGGLIHDRIWENIHVERLALAYDALRGVLATDAELLDFVRAKGIPVATGAELCTYVEDYLLRSAALALLRGHLRGNEGHHQTAAMAIALVLDDLSDRHPNSLDLLEYIYHGEGATADILVNGLSRDGGGHESPNYNRIKFSFLRLARMMEQFREHHGETFSLARYPDIFAHPKGRALFDHYIDILAADSLYPDIGDNGGIGPPRRRLDAVKHAAMGGEYVYAFRRWGDPRYATAAVDLQSGRFHPAPLWEPFPLADLEQAVRLPEAAISRRTRALDGYGAAFLESGAGDRRRTALLNYSSIIGHRQDDQLAIHLYANGLNLLPDLGYPKTWDYTRQWDKNSMAHNTVTVNERPFSTPRFFHNGARYLVERNGIHAVTAFHCPYIEGFSFTRRPGAVNHPCDLYERTLIMVEVSETAVYLVDVFAVNGGDRHDQSWHGMLVQPECPDLEWRVQEGGTLAGPEVPLFSAYTCDFGFTYRKGNFPSFLTGIRRAPLSAPATWVWRSGLPEGDGLTLHVIPWGGPAEVVMGRGRSPVWPEGQFLDYLLVRRVPEAGQASHFVSLLDPFQGTPTVTGVEVLSENPIQLRVRHSEGHDLVTVQVPDGPSRTTLPRPYGVRVRSFSDSDEERRDVRIGNWRGEPGSGYARGVITALDYEQQSVTIAAAADFAAAVFPGARVRIYSARRSSLFEVAAVEPSAGELRLILRRTGLLSRFRITGSDRGALLIANRGPFVTGHLDADGRPSDRTHDWYHGASLGSAADSPLVEGISNSLPRAIHLVEPLPDALLNERYVGRTLPVYAYRIGDQVEIILSE